jgi:hypothetical protein
LAIFAAKPPGGKAVLFLPEIAYQLWLTAMDYQEKAAKLNDGKLPEIGDPPIVVVTRV